MPIGASGALSWDAIRTEYGGSTPINMGDYYRGGARVPNLTVNAAIPTSGTIDTSAFYSTARVPALATVTNPTSVQAGIAANCSLRVNSTGVIDTLRQGTLYGTSVAWLLLGSNANYQCMISGITGTALTGSAINTWLACSAAQTWQLGRPTLGSNSTTGTLSFRDTTTLVVISTALITWYAERA